LSNTQAYCTGKIRGIHNTKAGKKKRKKEKRLPTEETGAESAGDDSGWRTHAVTGTTQL
jgi:hypothetical protein